MTLTVDELRHGIPFELSTSLSTVEPRYNIAPGTDVLCVVQRRDGLQRAGWMCWGYRLLWSAQPLVNARSESLLAKPVFRDAVRERRCLVPADSYFEWDRGPTRMPFRIMPSLPRVLWLAAIYDITPQGQSSLAIVTRAAHPDLLAIHHRMPVMFTESSALQWLRGDNLADLISMPYPHPLTVYPVSKAVNNPRHQGPQLHVPVPDHPEEP